MLSTTAPTLCCGLHCFIRKGNDYSDDSPKSLISYITKCVPCQGMYFPTMFVYSFLAFAFKESTGPLYPFSPRLPPAVVNNPSKTQLFPVAGPSICKQGVLFHGWVLPVSPDAFTFSCSFVWLTPLAQGVSERSPWPEDPDAGKGITFRQEGSDETCDARHNIAHGEGQAPANAIDCHYNQESSGQLHSS